MNIPEIFHKNETFFAQAVRDGHKSSTDPDGGLVAAVKSRVQAAALPALAAMDTILQVVLGIVETARYSIQFLMRRDMRSLQQATHHFELALRSIAAIGVGTLGAAVGVLSPSTAFTHLASTPIVKPA